MQTINSYLLEKLHINKNVKTFKPKPLPKTDLSNIYINKAWREFEFPEARYVVYKDYYRGANLHFADIEDMIIGIMFSESDFENFDPKKDIVFYSNDLKDILNKYFDYFKLSKIPSNVNDLDEWVEENEDKFDGYDNLSRLGEFYFKLDKYYENYPEVNDITDIEKIVDDAINTIKYSLKEVE